MDFFKRKVSRSGTNIELQPREFVLLEYFMCNPGRILSQTMILEHVWDYNFDPQTNVVEVPIHRLREKVDRCNVLIIFINYSYFVRFFNNSCNLIIHKNISTLIFKLLKEIVNFRFALFQLFKNRFKIFFHNIRFNSKQCHCGW